MIFVNPKEVWNIKNIGIVELLIQKARNKSIGCSVRLIADDKELAKQVSKSLSP